jgi:hypothetical protein
MDFRHGKTDLQKEDRSIVATGRPVFCQTATLDKV